MIESLGSLSPIYEVQVNTASIQSPIKLSSHEITFQDVILMSPGTSHSNPSSAKEKVLLSNTTDDPIEWFIETPLSLSSAITIEPLSGWLDPRESQEVVLSFFPDDAQTYLLSGEIVAIQNGEEVRLRFNSKGSGIWPSVFFDPPEIYLPIVPIGYESTVSFYIINNGCEIAELSAAVSQELRKDGLNLDLVFPEGCLLKRKGEKLPCIAKFTYNPEDAADSKAFSFTTRIQFCGANSSSYFLVAHGTSAACSLTLQPFLFKTKDTHKLQVHQDNRAMYVLSNPEPITNHAFQTTAGLPIIAGQESKISDFYSKIGSTLTGWFSDHVSFESQKDFPRNFSSSNGRLLIDLIQSLIGKKIPGISVYQVGHHSLEDRVKQATRLYNDLFVYMSSIGALLSNVKFEFLLTKDEYLCLADTKRVQAGHLSMQEAQISQTYLKFCSVYYDILSKEAWSLLLLQIFRVLILPTPKLRQSNLVETGNIRSGSNIYSDGEVALLNWSHSNLPEVHLF